MKLSEALISLHRRDQANPPFPVALITGFTAQPFLTFLTAHLQNRLPDRLVEVKEGRFGDITGDLERYLEGPASPVVLVLEWADLDSRLGWRQHGGWGRTYVDSICSTVERQLGRIRSLVERAGSTVAISLPTVPAAPVEPVPSWHYGELQVRLDALITAFASGLVSQGNIRLLHPNSLALVSPQDRRLDVKTLNQAGFPYQLPHADALANLLAHSLVPPPRLKGIITDLDNTFWAGILGENGVDGVSWDLDHHAAQFGAYQQMLQSLADSGVLIAIASKNDSDLVASALKRPDLLLREDSIFPVEANWGPKSQSVARILNAWNIGADSVVFIDDSPLELAEVGNAYPGMDCCAFSSDPNQVAALLSRLVDLFGKPHASEEDALRLKSLRARAELQAGSGSTESLEQVLSASEGVLTITRLSEPPDPRALELVNKTNQFNLNGERFNEVDWLEYLRQPHHTIWMASYADQFGRLGKISVLAARFGEEVDLDAWVLSCRAFGRRIEYAMLDALLSAAFRETAGGKIRFHFKATERNGPMRELLEAITGEPVAGECHLDSEGFERRKAPWFMRVEY